jgi:hypothetical protein
MMCPRSRRVYHRRGGTSLIPCTGIVRIEVKRSKQKKLNQRILDIGDIIGPRSSAAPEVFVGQEPTSATVIIIVVDVPSPGFQLVAGLVIRNWNSARV